MKNAEKLMKEVNKKINNWNERSQFKVSGVGNLSMSDMDSILLYCKEKIKHGNTNHLMKPFGAVGEVLSKNSIV